MGSPFSPMSFAAKMMELENIKLNEIIQTQKDNYSVFSVVCGRLHKVELNVE
jgi:hypothetical protein